MVSRPLLLWADVRPLPEVTQIIAEAGTTASESLEGETVEFKGYKSPGHIDQKKADLAEQVCAMANAAGGSIIVGVADSSNVEHGDWADQLVGVAPIPDPVTVRSAILGRLNAAPEFSINVTNLFVDGLVYLVVNVPRASSALVTTSSGRTLVRVGRESRPMTGAEIEGAVKRLQTYDWSAEDLGLEPQHVLSEHALTAARADFEDRRGIPAGTARDYLESIGATRNGLLTKGGLLFLGQAAAIKQYLGEYEFRFTWRTATADLLINDIWSGSLWDAVCRAKTHFAACNHETTFTFRKVEYPANLLDPVAFHEAFLNALVHRDYAVDGMVAVTFTAGDLRVSSPGTFYGGVTADNIGWHEPRHRNKALANILMQHHFVDRAGMGVLRMSRNSLRYGRSLPRFLQQPDSIEVSMQAEYLRPGIFVLAHDQPSHFDVPALVIANRLYERGHIRVEELELDLWRVTQDPWQVIQDVTDRVPYFELCGTNEGVFVRVGPSYRGHFEVARTLSLSTRSEKHVRMFSHLKAHGSISNTDATQLLGYGHASSTSVFLREAKYLKRSGSGSTSRWHLV